VRNPSYFINISHTNHPSTAAAAIIIIIIARLLLSLGI
jgi:hypothetical protein